jgi:O-antigen/teichoic acid export membrane protein
MATIRPGGTTAEPMLGADERPLPLLVRNIATKYFSYAVDALIGVLMLPFNLEHLGPSLYGLWILTAGVTTSFGLLDLGYGGSSVRFIARYRALRDGRALNEILSTLFVVYSAIGAVTFAIALALAPHLGSMFRIDPAQLATAQQVLLIISVYIAVRFAFSVFGAVLVGFQRYYLNNLVTIVVSLAAAAVNVAVLLAGYGLIELVIATTTVRLLGLLLYWRNAYRVYPALRITPRAFKPARLREVSAFSVYMLLLDFGYRLNDTLTNTVVLGAFIGPAAVALWAPAQRLSDLMTRLANQLNAALLPIVVDSDASQRLDRMRTTFLEGTRLSLAMVIPLAGGVGLIAAPLIHAWVGPSFTATAIVLQILAVAVVLRVGSSTAAIILQGGGEHARLAGYINLMAIGNLVISCALVQSYGLPGVALGVAVPSAVVAAFLTFPTACRRVQLPVAYAVGRAVWPAVWPALAIVAALAFIPAKPDASILTLGMRLAVAALLYLAFFLVAVGSRDRQRYLRKIRELVPRPRSRAGAASSAVVMAAPEGKL